MEKDKSIRINRLTTPAPDHRLDEMRSLLETHDLPLVMLAMLKYMPEASFRLMVEDLKCTGTFIHEQQAIFEEGGLPGQGALKVLVGKGPEKQLDPSECAKIGRIIASMRGYPRQYYVGMMNFLGASCRIHHEIKTAYMEEVRQQTAGGSPSEQVPDVVDRMFPGKKQPSQEEIKQREKDELERLKNLNKETMQEIQGEEGQAEYKKEFQRERAGTQPAEAPPQPEKKEEPKKRMKTRAQEFAQAQREKRGIQQEEEAQTPQETAQEIAKPEEKPEPKPKPKPKKKEKPKPQFKQYVPQLSISKGFSRPSFNRTMRK